MNAIDPTNTNTTELMALEEQFRLAELRNNIAFFSEFYDENAVSMYQSTLAHLAITSSLFETVSVVGHQFTRC